MRLFWSQHSGAVLWSVALHIVIVAALTLGIRFPRTYQPAEQGVVIKATVIDADAIRREQQRLEAEKQAEAEKRAEAEREQQQKQAAAEAARKAEAQAKAKAERQAEIERQAEVKRKAAQQAALAAKAEAERKAKLEAERKAQEQAKAKAQAEAERKAREEAQRKADEEAQRERLAEEARKRKEAEAAAREKAQAEADLDREIAAEAERTKARQSGLEDQYIRMLQNRIEQNWNRPPSAQPGLDCWVNVTQIPSGDVINVSVDRCNGDDAVVQSIERAVQRASPLPLPPVPALFERNLRIEFVPHD